MKAILSAHKSFHFGSISSKNFFKSSFEFIFVSSGTSVFHSFCKSFSKSDFDIKTIFALFDFNFLNNSYIQEYVFVSFLEESFKLVFTQVLRVIFVNSILEV